MSELTQFLCTSTEPTRPYTRHSKNCSEPSRTTCEDFRVPTSPTDTSKLLPYPLFPFPSPLIDTPAIHGISQDSTKKLEVILIIEYYQ